MKCTHGMHQFNKTFRHILSDVNFYELETITWDIRLHRHLCLAICKSKLHTSSDVKSSRTSLPQGQNFFLGLNLEYLSSTRPWTIYLVLVLVKLCVTVMKVLIIFLTLQRLLNCVSYYIRASFYENKSTKSFLAVAIWSGQMCHLL